VWDHKRIELEKIYIVENINTRIRSIKIKNIIKNPLLFYEKKQGIFMDFTRVNKFFILKEY
jgi:hypothetical protein